nr:galactose oxidase early set domain-containing protein [Fortiea sp. LEGE XX443]
MVGLLINPGLAIAQTDPNSAKIRGQWETIPFRINGIQAVHTALLPNGKVLIVNGSSNRNTLTTDNKFVDGVDGRNPKVIDNSAIFNPEDGTFKHISSPLSVQNGQSNDPFCSGHIHLENGNILFISGSNRYYPGELFEGSKQTNVFDWTNETWLQVTPQLKEGRWYPSPITLADGKIVIFSGLKYGKPGQITPTIEIYDPVDNKFHYLDLTYVKNSPFNTKVSVDTYDTIDVYPRVFPTIDGKLLITGDGAGKFPLEVHKSIKSYLMSVNKDSAGKFTVSFEPGPDRKALSKVYGTGLLDPNNEGDVLLIGGILGTNDINAGRPYLGKTKEDLEKEGISIASSLERWVAPQHTDQPNGEWKIVENFLDKPRAMNLAVILPTKEILTINGGQFAEYNPVYEPLLMTANIMSPGGYKTTPMNPAKFPRLYHNGALLLPDARVLSIGGNPSRAARLEDGTVRVDVLPDPKEYYKIPTLRDNAGNVQEFSVEEYYKDPQHYFAEGDTLPFVPAEIWQAEIFSPPYLFKDGPRPVITTTEPLTLKYDTSSTISVKDGTAGGSVVLIKLGTVTHAFDYGQRLADLEITQDLSGTNSSISFKAPKNANLYPPGYYMLFYVNNDGFPSKAKIVNLKQA